MAAGVMTAQDDRGYRGLASAGVSAVLHAVLLGLLAATSIEIASETPSKIPLVLREPAPPPPPPSGGAGAGAPAAPAAPRQPPAFVEQPKPVEAPKPIEKLKIAAKLKPLRDVARPLPTPATSIPPTTEMANAPAAAGGDAASGAAGGVVGGVAGGKIGGKLGGRLGGAGDDVWTADQVAVKPKVLEMVRAQYPPLALARLREGVVILQAIIDRRGAVEPDAVQVIQSQPPFDAAAIAAFRQWKFQPGRDESGHVVRVLVRQPIHFDLR